MPQSEINDYRFSRHNRPDSESNCITDTDFLRQFPNQHAIALKLIHLDLKLKNHYLHINLLLKAFHLRATTCSKIFFTAKHWSINWTSFAHETSARKRFIVGKQYFKQLYSFLLSEVSNIYYSACP